MIYLIEEAYSGGLPLAVFTDRDKLLHWCVKNIDMQDDYNCIATYRDNGTMIEHMTAADFFFEETKELDMYARKNSRNRAQRSRDKGFVPERDEKTREERSSTGGYEEITRYNDGSSTRHCGGPCGDQDYDEFGNEC